MPVRGAVFLTTALIVLAACGADDADDGAGAESGPPASAAAAGSGDDAAPSGETPEAAELAAQLTAAFANSSTLDGGSPFDGATLVGGDAVVWFWAPWCTICRAEAPEVAEVAEQYAAQVDLIGVPGRGALDEMLGFVEDTGTGSITHVADLDGAIWSAFGVFGQPAFAFIDDDGTVDVFVGGMGGDALAERIDELIAT